MAYARISVIGNIGKEPEMKYTAGGRAITEFSVAVSHSVKNQSTGEWEDGDTNWFRVSVWGDRAERVAEQRQKGDRVLVEGRFKAREFERKDGTTGYSLEITADDVIPFMSKGSEDGETRPARQSRRSQPSAPTHDDPADDIPWS